MKERKRKQGFIFLVVFIVFLILIIIGLGWHFLNSNSGVDKQMKKDTEEIMMKVEKNATVQKEKINVEEIEREGMENKEDVFSSDDVAIYRNSITLNELFKDNSNQKSQEDKAKENKDSLTDNNLNISGKGLGEEIDKNTKDDIYLTNEDDKLNYKDMEENNKIKTDENRLDKNENKVKDNTPSFDAEPEQSSPIVWEDGGEPARNGEQQNANCKPSGISSGGYLN